MREGFLRWHECGATKHKNAKTLETTFGLINIHPFQISVVYSFCHCFSIKFLKQYLVSVFLLLLLLFFEEGAFTSRVF